MDHKLSLIGFGEAGATFAAASHWHARARVFDIADRQAACHAVGASACSSLAEALLDAPAILSLVTADAAETVAQAAARSIAPGALYFDMNSVAPHTKQAAAKLIDNAGGRYVDVAIMAPVAGRGMHVPLLVSGPFAQDGRDMLSTLGFANIQIVKGEVGRASMIKMIRSIMIKGQEALTAEMMLAAQRADVVEEVLASLGDGWTERAAYNLERMRTHGLRRASEMEEVAKTLTAIGIEPLMTRGIIARQREMAG